MDPTYAALADRFTATVASITDWSAPSACVGWTAADVVDHIVTTQRDFLTAHTDLGPAPSAQDPVTQWRAHATAVAAALPTVADTAYDGPFGRTTVGETMRTFYGFDLIVHRWDIAGGVLTDDELTVLEAMVPAFGEHLYAEGICKDPVPVPENADRQTRALAALGRSA